MNMNSCFHKLKGGSKQKLIELMEGRGVTLGENYGFKITRKMKHKNLFGEYLYFIHEGTIAGVDYRQMRMNFLLTNDKVDFNGDESEEKNKIRLLEISSDLFYSDLDLEPEEFRRGMLENVMSKLISYSSSNNYEVLGYVPLRDGSLFE